jgi:hypothetical protein
LHKHLHLLRGGQAVINQAAITVRPLVEILNRADAKVCKIVPELLEILLAQHVSFLAIGTPCHDREIVAHSPYIRLLGGLTGVLSSRSGHFIVVALVLGKLELEILLRIGDTLYGLQWNLELAVAVRAGCDSWNGSKPFQHAEITFWHMQFFCAN